MLILIARLPMCAAHAPHRECRLQSLQTFPYRPCADDARQTPRFIAFSSRDVSITSLPVKPSYHRDMMRYFSGIGGGRIITDCSQKIKGVRCVFIATQQQTVRVD